MDSNNSLIERGFKCLARDEGGALFAYKYKPEKRMRVWVVSEDAEDSEHPHYTQVNDGLGVYDTVKWEDEEPTEIETLKSAVRQPLVNPIEFGGLSIHEQKGGGTYIIKSDLYKSVLDQNAEKRKERFNELTGEKISEESSDEPEEEPDDSADMVQKPPHYNKFRFQPIDIIAEVTNYYEGSTAFHIGTVLKYLCRAPFKGKLLEDLKKANYYLTRAIEEMEDDGE